MHHRAGEEEKVWFRSKRIIRENEQWFFLKREGGLEGPFETLEDAEMELMLFMRRMQSMSHIGE